MTSAAFRKLARRLPGAEEHSHMGHPDFRIGGRVFATLGYPRPGWAMVKLHPEEQAAFIAMQPAAFIAVKGKWGEQGSTNVCLRRVTAPAAAAALRAAQQAHSAPRRPPRARAT